MHFHHHCQLFSHCSAPTRFLSNPNLSLVDFSAFTTAGSSSFDRLLSRITSHSPPSTRRFRFHSFASFASFASVATTNDIAQSPCTRSFLLTLLYLVLTAPFLSPLSLVLPTLHSVDPFEIRPIAPSFSSSITDTGHSTRGIRDFHKSTRNNSPRETDRRSSTDSSDPWDIRRSVVGNAGKGWRDLEDAVTCDDERDSRQSKGTQHEAKSSSKA